MTTSPKRILGVAVIFELAWYAVHHSNAIASHPAWRTDSASGTGHSEPAAPVVVAL